MEPGKIERLPPENELLWESFLNELTMVLLLSKIDRSEARLILLEMEKRKTAATPGNDHTTSASTPLFTEEDNQHYRDIGI